MLDRAPDVSAVVAYNDLTTIAQGTVEMGRWAVAQLARRLRSGDEVGAASSVRLPVRLVVHGSTGRVRDPASRA